MFCGIVDVETLAHLEAARSYTPQKNLTEKFHPQGTKSSEEETKMLLQEF